jgi:hypothetical protein
MINIGVSLEEKEEKKIISPPISMKNTAWEIKPADSHFYTERINPSLEM